MAITDLKTRLGGLKAKFTRRNSISPSVSSADADTTQPRGRSVRSVISRGSQKPSSTAGDLTVESSEFEKDLGRGLVAVGQKGVSESLNVQSDQQSPRTSFSLPTKLLEVTLIQNKHDSTSTTDLPTPRTDTDTAEEPAEPVEEAAEASASHAEDPVALPTSPVRSSASPRPTALPRRQSILPQQQTKLIKTLLETEIPPPSRAGNLDYFTGNGPSTISPNMVSRKIWVRRPGASATLVSINEDDLVDDVRDMILKKYANSLGRNFDAPDVTLRILPREQQRERTLGPEEPMSRTIDAYFPGGQTVDEALIIDVPLKRTPRPSPRPGPHMTYYTEDSRPVEGGSDYFPPMPVPVVPSPHLPHSVHSSANTQPSHHPSGHAMSVLTTGHVPNLPSPGSTSRRHHRDRPRIGRQHTSSPTVINGHVGTPAAVNNGTQYLPRVLRSRTHSSASENSAAAPAPPPIPTPPAPDAQVQRVATPPPRVSSPRPGSRMKKSKKSNEHPSLPAGMLNGAVPPINVLIVEDNIINLRLLEAFMKRLKVRWQTAMNGKEAVTKWRAGGFHLVLMDIQLPVMSGLDATREIRRLERLNSIGVFSSSASSSAPERDAAEEPVGDDKLPSTVLFKSPVIIVALTASSLQSDRHEALAAGCNDFLTKVGFIHYARSASILTHNSLSILSG
jgi:osomolarity two-component system response regulator SSK1